jgi:hypothetical protein
VQGTGDNDGSRRVSAKPGWGWSGQVKDRCLRPLDGALVGLDCGVLGFGQGVDHRDRPELALGGGHRRSTVGP